MDAGIISGTAVNRATERLVSADQEQIFSSLGDNQPIVLVS